MDKNDFKIQENKKIMPEKFTTNCFDERDSNILFRNFFPLSILPVVIIFVKAELDFVPWFSSKKEGVHMLIPETEAKTIDLSKYVLNVYSNKKI